MPEQKQAEQKNNEKVQKKTEQPKWQEGKVNETRERSREKQKQKSQTRQRHNVVNEDFLDLQNYPNQEVLMNILGFSSFASSKKKQHTKSSVEGVLKNSSVARKYRQYMNRPGNFNRNLDAL